ncbi:MAG TPA: cache domain-containing protein [Candidatus Nanoarchaeia archaeon]|nr:cache domain-containing protein [Candidatus Nanoarchaeia archaeon]
MDKKNTGGVEPKLSNFTESLTFKTLLPISVLIILLISLFGFYLSTTTKENSEKFIIESVLIPEFELLAKEKNSEFEKIKNITEYTAKKIEEKILFSKQRSSTDTDELFNKYISKKPDQSYRSNLDESKGRFQMAAFHNNLNEVDFREKGYFIEAFLYFDPFVEGLMNNVHDSYFTTNDFIWEYGAPDWPLSVPGNETFNQYNWVYEADPEHNPSGQHVWTDMYYDDVQHEWMISSLMPIFDGKEYVGTLGQDLILKKIIEITKRSNIGQTGILFFIDNLGNIVAHPDTEPLIGKKATNDERLNLKTLPDEPLTKVLTSLPQESGYHFTEEKNRRIVMHFPLKDIKWKMVYVVDEGEFLKIASETNRQYIISFILFAIIVIVLILSIIRIKVTGPIKKLTEITDEISKDNLDKQIDIKSKDEIGNLADSFRKMTSDLKESRKKLKSYAENLEKQVDDKTKELKQKMEELEKFNKIAVGRELEMINLKKKIKELEEKTGDK